MTIYAWARQRAFPALPPRDARLIRVTDDTQVLAHCYWQPDRASRPTLLALHGLEGSSDVHYMRGVADKAWRRGWNAVLLNQRNCGGTEHLTPGLYHSGLTARPARSDRDRWRRPRGCAISASSATRSAATWRSSSPANSAPTPGCRCGRWSPCARRSISIVASAPSSGAPTSPYQFNFVRNLRRACDARRSRWPGAFDLSAARRHLDDSRGSTMSTPRRTTASGMPTNYYHQASAMRVVDRIRIPALILAADDDPFVPSAQFAEAGGARQPSRRQCGSQRPADIAVSSARRRTAATATGRSRRRSIFWPRLCELSAK